MKKMENNRCFRALMNKISSSFSISKTLIIVSLGLSIWALIIANVNYPLRFDDNKVLTFAGLLFTVIGAVFAFYFLIIGLDANYKQDKIQQLDKEIENKQLQIEKFARMETCQLDTMYEHLISQTNDKSLRISLRRDRARLATRSMFLPKNMRLQKMSELTEEINGVLLGEQSDIVDLMNIYHDLTEDKEIKDCAKKVHDELSEKLKQKGF